jgi:hypothetical protein
MRRVKLTQGYYALVDDEDYQRVMAAGPWHAHVHKNSVYAAHTGPRIRQKQKVLQLHTLILNVHHSIRVDHKDGDGLNNQKENLRVATRAQNAANQRLRSDSTSKYKGVYEKKIGKNRKRWKAYIRVQGKHVHLGCFATAKQAALAYDAAAVVMFGEFAYTNF